MQNNVSETAIQDKERRQGSVLAFFGLSKAARLARGGGSDQYERVIWPDILRAMGMVSIYIFHMGKDGGKLYPFMALFDIHIFFFVSGFFISDLSGFCDFFLKIKKLIIKVALPTVLWLFLTVLFFGIRNQWSLASAWNSMKTYLMMRKGTGIGGFWFLGFIFVLRIFHLIVSGIIRNKYIITIVSVVLYYFVDNGMIRSALRVTDHLWASADLIPEYWVYFCLGSLLFPELKRLNTPGKVNKSLRMILFFSAGIYVLLSYNAEEYIPLFSGAEKTNSLLGGCIFLLFFTVCSQFMESRLKKDSLIIEIGRSTLVLCASEYITRRFIDDTVAVFFPGITCNYPTSAICFSMVYLIAGYLIWQKHLCRLFPILGRGVSAKTNV